MPLRSSFALLARPAKQRPTPPNSIIKCSGRLQTQRRPLVGPGDRKVDQPGETEAAGKPTINGGSGKVGREERQRQGHADRPLAFALRTPRSTNPVATVLRMSCNRHGVGAVPPSAAAIRASNALLGVAPALERAISRAKHPIAPLMPIEGAQDRYSGRVGEWFSQQIVDAERDVEFTCRPAHLKVGDADRLLIHAARRRAHALPLSEPQAVHERRIT
jgi:hypothetical protein